VAGFDTDGATAAAPEGQEVNLNQLEPLLYYPFVDNGQGVLEPQYTVGADEYEPRLAESWSSAPSADGKGVTWTFKLRQGVTSCAGNEFTADDVIWTWQRYKSVSGAAPIGWFLGNVSAIFDLSPLVPPEGQETVPDEAKELLDTEVRKVDDYTVEFTQRNPNDLFPRVLTITFMGIFDSKVLQENATPDDPWAHEYTDTTDLPGFGAYCLKEWNKGTEVVFEANPNYYRGVPQFTSVTIRKAPQSANRVAAIINGDADIITVLTPQEIANLRTQDTVSVLGWQNNKGLILGMSYNFEPWNLETNAKIRQAIAYALPYDEIIQQDFGGDAVKWNGLIATRYFGFVDQPLYDTDVEKAKALLAEAGFPNGDGLDQYADGLKLFYVAERSNVLEPIANRIKTALAEIGIDITLNPISNAEYADRSLTKYDLPMFLADQDRPLAPDVGYGSLLFFVSKDKGGLNTPFAYSNPEFDDLYAQSAAIAGEERLPILQQMQELLMRDLPGVPIAEPTSFIAVKAGVVNCWAGQPYDLLEFWYFRTSDTCG
jgi:peptide/nickel transport system substrate-binding protein